MTSAGAHGAGSPSRVARNTAVRSLGEVVAKAGSLAFFVTMARELGREGFGAFMFALALTSALLIASGFGTDELIAREIARDRRRAGRDLADAVALKLVASIGLLALAAAVANLGGYSSDTRVAVYLVGAGVALEVLAKSWHSVFQAHERLELVSLCLIVQRMLTAVAGIAVLAAGGGLVGAAFVFALGALAGLVLAEVMLRRTVAVRRAAPRRSDVWRLLRAGVPIGVAGVLFTLLLRVDVMLLSFLGSNAEVGTYSAAFRLVEGTQFLSWAFGAAMLPWLARADADLGRGFGLGLKFMAALLLPIGLVFALFAGPLVELLYGADFSASALPLRLLGLTVVMYGLQAFCAIVLIARDAPGAITRVVAVVVVVNLAANLVAIPRYGADGAAAVALGSSLLLAVLGVRQAAHRAGRPALGRAFCGPAVAGGTMALVAVVLPGPWVLVAIAALAVYATVLVGFELAVFGEDAAIYRRALPAISR